MIDRKQALAAAGSVLATAGILFVARRLIHYAGQTDLGRLGQGGWLALAGLALLYGAANTLLGAGWWLLLRRGEERPALSWAVRIYGTAQLAKYLPGNIFHLAGRQALGLAAGLPAPLLASSMAWELALCAVAGLCLGLLALPDPFGLVAAGAALVAVGTALRRWRFDRAFACFVAFLALAGFVFSLLIALLGPGEGWAAIGGAYVLAWLAGLVVPGAPAGLGVREAALMLLLAGHVDPAQAAEAAVLGRIVTLAGDFLFYLGSGRIGRHRLFAAAALAFTLVLQGAVPFLAVPTLGQAVWNGAFAQSFANQPLFSLYAHNFGVPEPAAIAFGLATAWPAGLLIRFGLHPADAYSAVAAVWFTLAFFSARALARRVEAGPTAATLLATLWLSLPMIWGHADFSMLSCGMALLPFYFLAARRLTTGPASIALYAAAALLAVFMDGYSFMMFALAGAILLVRRPPLLGIHLGIFGFATLLYTRYVGFGGEATAPLDFFRGWGLDLSFIAIPSEGMQWLFDRLHLSLPRSHQVFYGDRSVWETTFCLPILLAGLACFRPRRPLAPAALAIALLGFWLALGPSVKIDARKSLEAAAAPTMAAEMAPIPTGSAWLSEHVPGFRAMRASYRWEALGLFGLWLLVAMGSRGRYAALWLSGLILCNLPHMPARWFFDQEQRAMFLAIDHSLVNPLGWAVKPGERVVFLPFRNDFLPAYAAARLNLSAYNIGGDKNLDVAWNHWPIELRRVRLGTVDENAVTSMLGAGLADAVVLLYPHGLWAAHLWPCLDEANPPLFGKLRENYAEIGDFYCPADKKAELAPLVETLRRRGDLTVTDAGLFAIVRRD